MTVSRTRPIGAKASSFESQAHAELENLLSGNPANPHFVSWISARQSLLRAKHREAYLGRKLAADWGCNNDA